MLKNSCSSSFEIVISIFFPFFSIFTPSSFFPLPSFLLLPFVTKIYHAWYNRFFQGIAIEHLIEPGVKAEYFNDDKLGIVLEQLYQKGLSKIFMSVVLEAVKTYQLETDTVHLDSSSRSCSWKLSTRK